jgi:hypothetical protein
VAEELHLASTVADGVPSSCVVLKRHWLKTGQAQIAGRCPRHTHSEHGTIAYLEGILPEIADKLTKDGLKEYLGREFASDLRQGLYAMAISDGRGFEPVPPQRYRGIKAMANTISLGRLGTVRGVCMSCPGDGRCHGQPLRRGGTRICLLTDLDDFKALPWIDKRLEGYVRCDHLKRTADKTAVVQEQVYQAFVAGLRGMEPEIKDMIGKISAESQERRFHVVMGKAGKLIDKFLRYRDRGLLAELAMRTPGLGQAKRAIDKSTAGDKAKPEPAQDKQSAPRAPVYTRAPFIELRPPPRAKAELRSWYDPRTGCICVNREHEEFMLAQRQDSRCIRYLFSIWAKRPASGVQRRCGLAEMVGRIAGAKPLLCRNPCHSCGQNPEPRRAMLCYGRTIPCSRTAFSTPFDPPVLGERKRELGDTPKLPAASCCTVTPYVVGRIACTRTQDDNHV